MNNAPPRLFRLKMRTRKYRWRKNIDLFLLLFSGLAATGQDAGSPKDTVAQKDLIDGVRTVLGKGPRPTSNGTVVQSGIRWSVVPAAGYTLHNGFLAGISSNGAFFTSRQRGQNQSIIYNSVVVTQRSQLTFTNNHNIWLAGNSLILAGDHRYWIYPQETFGLGGDTKPQDRNLLQYRLLRLNQLVYRRLHNEWYGGIGYLYNYNHRISEAGNEDGTPSDFALYGNEENTLSTGPSLALLHDRRTNQNNPVAGGHYLNLQFQTSFRWLGSTNNWRSFLLDARQYIGVGPTKKNILALWGIGWFLLNSRAPYLDLPSTAWDANNNSGRGYIQGRFRGKNMVFGEAEYRMLFTRNGLLGGVLFANAQTVTDWPSNRFTRIHPGVGGGLRLKFNKESGANIALDYGFGADGSRGFFVNLGEVF